MAQDKVTVSLQGNTVTATAVDVSAATVPASSVNFVGAQGPSVRQHCERERHQG